MANYDGHLKLKALRSCDRKSLQRLNARLLKLEIQIERDKAQLENSQAQLIEAKSKNRDFTDQAIVLAALSASKDLATRARLRQEIRRKVARSFWNRSRATIWPGCAIAP